jgi:hypothetical protein
MRHRAELMAPDARAAINLVDVAFDDVLEVKEARQLFMEAANADPFHATTIVERYHHLIEAVARALSLQVSGKDVRLGYYPVAVSKLDEAAIADAEEKIARRQATERPRATPNALEAFRTAPKG